MIGSTGGGLLQASMQYLSTCQHAIPVRQSSTQHPAPSILEHEEDCLGRLHPTTHPRNQAPGTLSQNQKAIRRAPVQHLLYEIVHTAVARTRTRLQFRGATTLSGKAALVNEIATAKTQHYTSHAIGTSDPATWYMQWPTALSAMHDDGYFLGHHSPHTCNHMLPRAME